MENVRIANESIREGNSAPELDHWIAKKLPDENHSVTFLFFS